MAALISIDEIIRISMPPREKLRKFFWKGAKFRVGVFRGLTLFKVEDGHSTHRTVPIETDVMMEARDVKAGGETYRWLVYTDPAGDESGLSVEALLSYHKNEAIEIERLNSRN